MRSGDRLGLVLESLILTHVPIFSLTLLNMEEEPEALTGGSGATAWSKNPTAVGRLVPNLGSPDYYSPLSRVPTGCGGQQLLLQCHRVREALPN